MSDQGEIDQVTAAYRARHEAADAATSALLQSALEVARYALHGLPLDMDARDRFQAAEAAYWAAYAALRQR